MAGTRPLLYLASGTAEQALLGGLRTGEQASYRQLYELYATRLQRTLERCYRDSQLAQDAIQSTFLAVFRSVHQFDGRSTLLTWMTRIAIREGQRLSQRQARARCTANAFHDESAVAPLPHDRVERDETAALSALIDALPAQKRMALLLFEIEGFSVQEIAEITDEPRGTVLARLSRTRTELREALRRREEPKSVGHGLGNILSYPFPKSKKVKSHG